MATLLTGRLGAASCCWAPLARRALTSMAAWTPHAERRPFQQPNRRRDDQLLPRMPPAVPEVIGQPFVQAWLSAWGEPRAGIAPLRADIWTLPLRTDIVHRVVTWQRACMRQGTSKTKGRHEVRGGGRKPRPQKGSGRSRQGSIRSPLFVGGGHAHPKRPRDFSYKLNLKVQSLGIKTALSDKWRRGALIVMRDYALASTEQRPTGMARRTAALSAQLSQELSALGIDLSRQRVMMVTSDRGWSAHDGAVDAAAAEQLTREQHELLTASSALEGVLVRTVSEASTLELVKHHLLMISLEALDDLNERFSNERVVGFVANPSAMPSSVVAALASGKSSSAQQATSS
eukprot:jgi/Chrpa1/8223/Chrysochromulina_OHIO_Genome00002402-RA